MGRIHSTMLLLFLCGASALRAGHENESEGPILFYTDYTSFSLINEKGFSYTQLHFFMTRNQLTFQANDSLFTAGYRVEVTFKDVNNDKNTMQRSWNTEITDHITSADTSLPVPLMFENGFAVKPGTYQVEAKLTDINKEGRSGLFKGVVEVPDFDKKDLMISQLELLTQIQRGGHPDEMFVKNGYLVHPNPTRFYGSNLPRLSIYAEVYNLEYNEGGENSTYTAEFILTDEAGSVVREFPPKEFSKAGRSAILIHGLTVISYPSGRYYLVVRIKDNANQAVTQTKKLFIVYREGESIYETQAGDSFFKDLDEAGAVRAGNIIMLIGTDTDKKVFAQLDLEGKRKFLDRFWKERDPSPGTKSNEALMDIYKRYEDANVRFSTPNRPGWKTDMGRVLVVYGSPAQIEKHEFESDKRPYQIWYYLQLKDQPTQTIFVFGDVDDSGQRLIHSNARGEFGDPGWLKRLDK